MKVRIKESVAVDAATPFDEPQVGLVSETITDPVKLKDFGFTKAAIGRAKILAENANDEDPEYVVVRTEEGWSESGRLYDAKVLDTIAEQLVEKQPVGHLGHIPDDDFSTAFPDPQTAWFGALTKTEPSTDKRRIGEQVRVIYAAGYNLPGAKIRTFLRTAVVRGTSWVGRADQVPIPGKGVKVENFELLNLDWARKLSEGMPTSRVVAIAREMKEGSTSMDKELSQVTPEEFKEANPNGHALLVHEATAEKDETITEMQTVVDAAEEDKKLLAEIRSVLKLNEDANPLEKIGHLVKRLGEKAKLAVEDALDAILAEKVPDEDTRKLVRRLMPVTEMQTAAEDAEDAEAVKTLVTEMTTKAFDDDEMIQQYVSEQAPPIVRRREEIKGTSGDKDTDKALEASGMTRSRVSLGSS